MLDDLDEILERVQARGEPSKIFEILPKCTDNVRESLLGFLLEPGLDLPVAEAKGALESPDAVHRRPSPPTSSAGPARKRPTPPRHVDRRAGTLARRSGKSGASPTSWQGIAQRPDFEGKTWPLALTPCVQSLVWAAGRLGNSRGSGPRKRSPRPGPTIPFYRPIRREAVLALASKVGDPRYAIDALESGRA